MMKKKLKRNGNSSVVTICTIWNYALLVLKSVFECHKEILRDVLIL